MKKKLTLVLAMLLLQTITACGSAGTADDTTAFSAENGDQTNSEVTTDSLGTHIPENDFGGYEFRMLDYSAEDGWSTIDYGYDLFTESENGDVFNDAVWKRNQTIEEKYNIKFSLDLKTFKELVPYVNQLVAAGDHAYDLVFSRLYEVPALIYNQSLLDLHDLPVIDFSKPWWDQNSIDNLSIGGKLYLAASDITTMDKDATYFMMYNKQLAEDYKISGLYDAVKEGKWTYDKMCAHMKGASSDLNGDTVLDRNDQFGLLGSHDVVGGLFRAAGGRLADKNKDDIIELSFQSEKNFEIIDRIFDIIYGDDYFNMHLHDLSNQEFDDMFAEGKALFMWRYVGALAYLRNKDFEFGVLPCPKYDESQKDYLNMISVHQAKLLSVPVTTPDLERTGTIIEAMACLSNEVVQPAYYDVNLNIKGVRDEESIEMLKLIFANRIYDVGDIFFSEASYKFLTIQSTGSRDIASFWATYEPSVKAQLEQLIEVLELE